MGEKLRETPIVMIAPCAFPSNPARLAYRIRWAASGFRGMLSGGSESF